MINVTIILRTLRPNQWLRGNESIHRPSLFFWGKTGTCQSITGTAQRHTGQRTMYWRKMNIQFLLKQDAALCCVFASIQPFSSVVAVEVFHWRTGRKGWKDKFFSSIQISIFVPITVTFVDRLQWAPCQQQQELSHC